MKLKNLILFGLAASSFFAVVSCEKDEPEVPNEEELITTLIAEFTGAFGDVTFRFEDLDGDGGDAPVITTGDLTAGAVYSLNLTFLNESESPVEDITLEIEEEGDEHQIFFSNDLGILINYSDDDGTGKPIGLSSSVATAGAGTGTLTITLRHEPDKDAAGVSTGDITNAGGETDIEVNFPVTVL